MAHYFCVDHGYFEHRKTRRLMRKEGAVAALVPLKLWRYASMCQADGDFTGYDIEELVEIVDLDNVHVIKRVLLAMRDVGFFDAGTWKLHDFEEYNSYAMKRKLSAKNAALSRWAADKARKEKAAQKRGEPLNGAVEHPPPSETNPPPEGGGAEVRSTRPRADIPSKAQSSASVPQSKRKSGASEGNAPTATARAFHIRKTLETHPGRLDSSIRFPSEDEKKFSQAEYRTLQKTLAALDKEIALTAHKPLTPAPSGKT